jgi:hypothetical protein
MIRARSDSQFCSTDDRISGMGESWPVSSMFGLVVINCLVANWITNLQPQL